MTIMMAARHVSQLGASFRPSPPKLSLPQLNLSSPPPAQLVHDAQNPNTRSRSPVVELVLESPVVNSSLIKESTGNKAKCYIVDAEQDDSAISDTEETPNAVLLKSNVLKRERSKKPQRRPVPVDTDGAPQETVKPQQSQRAPLVQWDINIHVSIITSSSSPATRVTITDMYSVMLDLLVNA